MKKIILTYGLISGLIVSAMLILSMPLHNNGTLDFNSGMVVGYATMVLALSLIFFGIKTYRDNVNGGVLKFWQGIKIGLLITLVSGVMYCMAWEICYHTLAHDFMQRMTDYYVEEKRAGGASDQELAEVRGEMQAFEKMYNNPLIRFGYTLFEILPVGVLVTFISAGLLRRKKNMVDLRPS